MSKDKNRFKLTSFNDIELVSVEWLWYPYLPLGKISFLSGDPGVGKSFITTFLTSIVSKGECFPFSNTNTEEGKVIIQNGEDGAGDTIKKRLIAFQTNFDNVYMIDLKEEKENSRDLLLTDIKELDDLFSEIHPKLVIFDPITVFLGDIDMNSATKVRRVLRPISRLAEKHNCAILFVIHRNKGMAGVNQIYRMLGSIDLGGIARSIISIGKGKNETLFIHSKSNLSERGKTLAFRVIDEKIEWLGERDYIEEYEVIENQTQSPRENARELILECLKDKELQYNAIVTLASEKGISEKTLERARDELKNEGIIDKKYVGKIVYWYLKEVVSSNTHI